MKKKPNHVQQVHRYYVSMRNLRFIEEKKMRRATEKERETGMNGGKSHFVVYQTEN